MRAIGNQSAEPRPQGEARAVRWAMLRGQGEVEDRDKSRTDAVRTLRFAHCGSRGGIRDGGRDSRWRGGSCDCAANRDGADKLRTREIIEHGIHGDSPAF